MNRGRGRRGGRGGRGRGAVEEPTEEERVAEAIQDHMARPTFGPIWVDLRFLDDTGLRDRVTQMLTVSGWPGLLTMTGESDREDTAEFLATFDYLTAIGDHGIRYRHRGVETHCSIEELRQIFGWSDDGEVYIPAYNNWLPAWHGLAPDYRYEGGESKAKCLDEPIMFYLHHVLSKTLFAKKNADKVGRPELSVLHMLRVGTEIDWAHYLCKHWKNLRANSPIGCGGLITFFLRSRHDMPVPHDHHISPPTFADRIWFQCGQNIQVTHEGEIQWVYFLDPARRPPPVVPRPRGRPRNARGRGRGLVIAEPQQHQGYQQQGDHH